MMLRPFTLFALSAFLALFADVRSAGAVLITVTNAVASQNETGSGGAVTTADMTGLGSGFPATHTGNNAHCLLYTSPSPRDKRQSRMPSSA